MEDEQVLGINAFLVILLVTLCVLLGLVLKKTKWSYYLPESGAAMIFGFIVGGLASLAGEEEADRLVFSPNVFFFILLPPIIFEAGYTLEKKPFFRNLGSIMTYAIFGTLVSTILFGLIMWGFARAGAFPLDTANPLECLLFGSLISATDPVATLAILGAPELKADPLLYAIVFGESVLNDAVAIVLYNTFAAFVDEPFGAATLFQGVGLFFGISLGSTLVGIFIASIGCYTIKSIDFSEYPHYEFTLITLFAFASYFFAEMCTLSGIMSLFFAAITMSHYNVTNITEMTQHTTHQAYKTIAQICETFVFVYIGVTAGIGASPLVYELQWSFTMVVCTIFCILLGRFFNIYPLTWILNRYRNLKIPGRMQFPMWFAGLRGAVAFALSLRVPTTGGPYIVSTTLCVVMFTTLVMGGTTLPVLRKFGMTGSDIMKEFEDAEAAASSVVVTSKIGGESGAAKSGRDGDLVGVMSNRFVQLDDKYFSRWFAGKWKGKKPPSHGHGHGHGAEVEPHPNEAPVVGADHGAADAEPPAVEPDHKDGVELGAAGADGGDAAAPADPPAPLHTQSAAVDALPTMATMTPSRSQMASAGSEAATGSAANPFK